MKPSTGPIMKLATHRAAILALMVNLGTSPACAQRKQIASAIEPQPTTEVSPAPIFVENEPKSQPISQVVDEVRADLTTLTREAEHVIGLVDNIYELESEQNEDDVDIWSYSLLENEKIELQSELDDRMKRVDEALHQLYFSGILASEISAALEDLSSKELENLLDLLTDIKYCNVGDCFEDEMAEEGKRNELEWKRLKKLESLVFEELTRKQDLETAENKD